MAKSIMIQGAGSNVGKSMIVAGLARVALRRGVNVLPFKPQNMSNNASVTIDGGEIGRAQAFQAFACGADPHTDMNPVLLKPESETGCQIVVHGKRLTTIKANQYSNYKKGLMGPVLESLSRLKERADLVIVEGAGSPAEVNLRKNDIANMGFATKANIPVIIIGDIDRGGVIAQLVGTKAVIDSLDAAFIKGFIINKFRGDPRLFDDGYKIIEKETGWKGLGVLPYFKNAMYFPAEDILDLKTPENSGSVKIACLILSRIANFDDLDPLGLEKGVNLVLVKEGEALPGDCDLVIIPGSKSTFEDLHFLRRQGWDVDLLAHKRRGGKILGICGGYQMLGVEIKDPLLIESSSIRIQGLGLLNVVTEMQPSKTLSKVTGEHLATKTIFEGYEIHMGQTSGPDCDRPFCSLENRFDGAISKDKQVFGSYVHGIFSSDNFRKSFLKGLDRNLVETSDGYYDSLENTLDELADHIENNLDVTKIFEMAR